MSHTHRLSYSFTDSLTLSFHSGKEAIRIGEEEAEETAAPATDGSDQALAAN